MFTFTFRVLVFEHNKFYNKLHLFVLIFFSVCGRVKVQIYHIALTLKYVLDVLMHLIHSRLNEAHNIYYL